MRENIEELINSSVIRLGYEYPDEGQNFFLSFYPAGLTIYLEYWRLIKRDISGNILEIISSFDDKMLYGRDKPLDVTEILKTELSKSMVIEAYIQIGTADIIIKFDNLMELQIFGFTEHEAWSITDPSNNGQDFSDQYK